MGNKEKREAFIEGARFAPLPGAWLRPETMIQAEALRRYPKETRPRVVADPHPSGAFYIVAGGMVKECDSHGNRLREPTGWITPERVALWADLLANPTEEVDNG